MKILLGVLIALAVAIFGAGGFLVYDYMTGGDILASTGLSEAFDKAASAAGLPASPGKGSVTVGADRREVFEGGHPREESRLLKDVGRACVVGDDLTLGGAKQSRKQMQQGGLSDP